MDTESKYGIKKSQAILLFVQMIFVILILAAPIYVLLYLSHFQPNGWMIAVHVLLLVSVIALILYSAYGYKLGDKVYHLTIVPFLAAVFVTLIMPGRSTAAIGILAMLFALTALFLARQESFKFTSVVSLCMVVAALTFSIYSSITADLSFLGEFKSEWPAYVAMYVSIFAPTIMAATYALTYNVRVTRKH